MKKIPIIPDCYKDLPGSTLLNSSDVAKIFGYKHSNSITYAEKSLSVPKHDFQIVNACNNSTTLAKKTHYWKLSTIRDWGKVE